MARPPTLLCLGVLLVSSVESASPQSRPAAPSFAEPGIAPDRSEIAFVSGGDIWTVPAAGGVAHLLVSHTATESRPLFSPDGTRLAFGSTRTGNGDIYVLTLATGELRRLTFDDSAEQPDAWSPDGRGIWFSSNRGDIAGMNDLWRVSAEGGTPMPVAADRYASEYWAAPAPTGAAVAMTARGIVSTQWWRRGHSHLDESEIWILRDPEAMRYERVSTGGSKDAWPMWLPDGRTLYHVTDRNGVQNLVRRTGPGDAVQVTRFTTGRVLWPTISRDGRTIAFERDFRIWTLETGTGEAREVPVTLRGAPAGPTVERMTYTNQLQDLALSPDGRKVAFVVRGEVFAAAARDGGDATRVTETPARERQVRWAPDSRRLVYVSDRDGSQSLYLYDFGNRTESRLTNAPAGDVSPVFSPDGKSLAFKRGGRELWVIDVESKRERRLATAQRERVPFLSDGRIAWSPDGRWIAYVDVAGKLFSNVYLVPADGGGPGRQITFLANVFGGQISWSPDGTYLLYDSSQRTEERQLARVDLVPRTPRFREDQFRDLFRQQTPRPSPADRAPPADSAPRDTARAARAGTPDSATRPPRRPVQIVFDDIRRRLSMLDVGVDVVSQSISPDGRSLLLVASAAGQQNLYVYPLDELAREQPVARQLTSTPGNKAGAQWSPDGREVYYLEQGRISTVNVESRQTRTVAVTAQLSVDFDREKAEVFSQAWRYLADNFADSAMNGVDWAGVREAYAPRIAGARTPDEMRRILSLMVGELNASHLGVGAGGGGPAAGGQQATGRLGVRFDRAQYERDGRLRITEVIPLSPAAVSGVRNGEYLLAVDGRRVDARTSLDELLANTVDRRVALTLAAQADGRSPREVAVRPVNGFTEKALVYRQWVEERRAYVEKASGGRLGYVHMIDMGQASLAQLFVDLDQENHSRQGVVVDVRNNNGGFVNAYALDVFARRPYMTMTPRGLTAAPARTVLGQRALEAPAVLVTNQHSLSDAEDFTEGWRALKLGPVVGEPTAGWILYTSNVPLIDGTVLRIPSTIVRGSDGQVMEMRPRPVDVTVARPLGESYSGKDSQLDAAVRELLKLVPARTAER